MKRLRGRGDRTSHLPVVRPFPYKPKVDPLEGRPRGHMLTTTGMGVGGQIGLLIPSARLAFERDCGCCREGPGLPSGPGSHNLSWVGFGTLPERWWRQPGEPNSVSRCHRHRREERCREETRVCGWCDTCKDREQNKRRNKWVNERSRTPEWKAARRTTTPERGHAWRDGEENVVLLVNNTATLGSNWCKTTKVIRSEKDKGGDYRRRAISGRVTFANRMSIFHG